MRPLFKLTFLDLPTTEYSRNFPKDTGVIILIRKSGRRLKLWDYLYLTKGSFSMLRIPQVESPGLKKLSSLCSGGALVLFHVS